MPPLTKMRISSHRSSPVPIKRARIEIIPLIDIMFFLLAAFMLVSLTMINMKGIDVNPDGDERSAEQQARLHYGEHRCSHGYLL